MGREAHTPDCSPRQREGPRRLENRFSDAALFRAATVCTASIRERSKFNWSPVDIVTDQGVLRKLGAWANNEPDHWRIDTQLVGDRTVLTPGWSPATKQTSSRSQETGYGFNFEKAPAPGCERGIGHHRIVTYVRAPRDVFRMNVQVLIADRISVVWRWWSVSKWTPACPPVLLRRIPNPAAPGVLLRCRKVTRHISPPSIDPTPNEPELHSPRVDVIRAGIVSINRI